MIWQDLVIAIAQGVFALALIPTVLEKGKPPLATSLPISIGLIAITVAVASLELWWSAISTFANAALWAVIAFQRWHQR